MLMATLLVALGAARAEAALLINEVAFNPPGTDAPNEYVELRNTDSAPLAVPAGTYLVALEGDGTGAGDVQNLFSLGGLVVPANGYLVIAQQGHPYAVAAGATLVVGTGPGFAGAAGFSSDTGNDIENVSASFLLITSATAPTLLDDADSNNDGTIDGVSWTVLDSVGVLDNGATDISYGALTFVNGAGGVGANLVRIAYDAGYVGRFGNSTGSAAADWVAAELTGTAQPFTLSTAQSAMVPRTTPAALAGLPLDHVGSANFLNDAPVNLVEQAMLTGTEDTSFVLSSMNGNSIRVSDRDILGSPLAIALMVSSGTITLGSLADITITGGANGTSAVAFTGTLVAANAALEGLVYAPGANQSGEQTLTILTSDQGHTGAGGTLTDMDTVTFTVSAANDAPVNTLPAAQTVQIGMMLPFSAANGNAISVADVDAGTSSVSVAIGVTAGTLTVVAIGATSVTGNSSAALTITGAQANVTATLDGLVFNAPATGQTVTLTMTSNDQGATGAGGPQIDTDTLTINVSGAPFITANAGPFMFTTALGATSPTQSYLVMAGNVPGSITLTTTAPFEIAASAAGPFMTTTTLPGSSGGMVFVRYRPTTGTSHDGMITYAATGVTPPNATVLSGTVFRITTTALPEATQGLPYTATAMAAGGVAPIAWSLQSPPAWLAIDPSTGVLSGTPPTESDPSVTIVATDAQTPAQTVSITLALTVIAPITPDAPPDAPVVVDAMVDAAEHAPPDDADIEDMPDAPLGSPTPEGEDTGGCCGTSRPDAAFLLAFGVLLVVGRRRSTRH